MYNDRYMQDTLRQLLVKTAGTLNITEVEPQITASESAAHGDYASNIALVVAKKVGKNPRDIASEIVAIIENELPMYLEKVEIAGPGFINFTLSKSVLLDKLSGISKSTEIDEKILPLNDQKIMIEFTDPNPFKEFHIGHLYSNIVGESLSRLMESQGATVRRVNYQGDVGLHVAKALYGLQQKIKDQRSKINDLEESPLEERAKFLGEAYALGATKYEEDESAKAEIKNLNKKVYEKDPEIQELYEKGRQWTLDYFETIYQRLGTKFEQYYFESEAGPRGIALVREYLEKGIFEESQGAVIFPGEKYGLHSRVFINSLGLPTYEAKELGLAFTKYEDWQFDRSIIITGNEIDEYFKVLLKALSVIGPEIAEKTTHLSHGMVRLPEGKMSSRTGNVITGEWLLNTAVEKAKEKMTSNRIEVENTDEVAEKVGVGAIKYALLKNGIGKDIAFSFDESISFEGNAGPYLQYTFARTQSVLRKAGEAQGGSFAEITLSAVERELLVHLIRFDEVVAESAKRYSPNLVASYLFDLAQQFNLFYQKCPILKVEGDVRAFRLQLTENVGKTLKEGLRLLGIQAPERM